jgi:hypothetical protein
MFKEILLSTIVTLNVAGFSKNEIIGKWICPSSKGFNFIEFEKNGNLIIGEKQTLPKVGYRIDDSKNPKLIYGSVGNNVLLYGSYKIENSKLYVNESTIKYKMVDNVPTEVTTTSTDFTKTNPCYQIK